MKFVCFVLNSKIVSKTVLMTIRHRTNVSFYIKLFKFNHSFISGIVVKKTTFFLTNVYS